MTQSSKPSSSRTPSSSKPRDAEFDLARIVALRAVRLQNFSPETQARIEKALA